MLRALSISGVVACLASGCGTCLNLVPDVQIQNREHFALSINPPKTVYGGVRLDAAVAAKSVQKLPSSPIAASVFLSMALIDLPMSFVGDTLTLPITVFDMAVNRAVEAYYFPEPRAPETAADGEELADDSAQDESDDEASELLPATHEDAGVEPDLR